jgi:hypothetical protein
MSLPRDEKGRYWIPAKADEPRVELDCSCGYGLNAPERIFDYMTDRHAAAHNKGIDGLAAAATWDIRHFPAEQPGPEPVLWEQVEAEAEAADIMPEAELAPELGPEAEI